MSGSHTSAPETIYLKDYTPPAFWVESIDLHFELDPANTTVRSTLKLSRNPKGDATAPLVLNGQNLTLIDVQLDGEAFTAYRVDDEQLTIDSVPEQFTLQITTAINPEANTALEGLYRSKSIYCTQCEAEGFRKITYYLDRPDVLAPYTTTVVADRASCPVLLSNGNPVEQGELADGRHWVRWQDPFKKPSYLFALVAGDLACIEDQFTTRSGREVVLRIYVEHHNRDKCDHAMQSLKNAMRWDEERFGLEYDLDIYMIVAVDDFNMGAMENKGLNVFNSKYVLARPETATDTDYEGIESVIGHEYFHNWTGNRVTCRDWFQLSLKEGLTVFRDQEFSADMGSIALKRIQEVRTLRSFQFPEDAGPMAHPVRPSSYIEINNFYTATVYNKGAEVVRLYHSLLGNEGFNKGLTLYLNRHDGQAATTDDFRRAMEEANKTDLSQIQRWYEQAGTPRVELEERYDAETQRYHLTARQSCPATPGQTTKEPFLIPLRIGLLDESGQDLPLLLEGETESQGTTRVLRLTESEQTFCFEKIPCPPVPSVLRGFSAPVHLKGADSTAYLVHRLAHDSDPFNRWEAGQSLLMNELLGLVHAIQQGQSKALGTELINAFRQVLQDYATDPALTAEMLTVPSESLIGDKMDAVDVEAVHQAREQLIQSLANPLQTELWTIYQANQETGAYEPTPAAIARRSIKNVCLSYLMRLATHEILEACHQQYRSEHNMTDEMVALELLLNQAAPEYEQALERFEQRWKHDALVMDKWFSLQARSPQPGTLDRATKLLSHPDFSFSNPNRVRSLIGSFASGNPINFHQADGAGYRFLVDQILLLEPKNPQLAARLLSPLTRWRRYIPSAQGLMKEQLQRIKQQPKLSTDVFEVVEKSLQES